MLYQSERDAPSATTAESIVDSESDSAQSNLLQIRLGRCSLTLLTFYTEGSVRTAYVVHYNQRGSREPPAAAHEGNERVVGRHPRCPIRQYSLVGTTNGCSGQRRLAFDFQVPTLCDWLDEINGPTLSRRIPKNAWRPASAGQVLVSDISSCGTHIANYFAMPDLMGRLMPPCSKVANNDQAQQRSSPDD